MTLEQTIASTPLIYIHLVALPKVAKQYILPVRSGELFSFKFLVINVHLGAPSRVSQRKAYNSTLASTAMRDNAVSRVDKRHPNKLLNRPGYSGDCLV